MATLMNTDSLDEVYEYVNEEGQFVEYDLNRLVVSDAAEEKIPSQAEQKMTGFRMKVFDKRPDGKIQDFLIRSEELGSGGVKESHDQSTGEMNGYSLPLYMWNQEGATPTQKAITDFLEKKLLPAIKEKIVEKRDTFRQPDLEVRDLKKMGLFYRPKEATGKINLDDAPSWYPKIIVSKKKNYRIVTQFYQLDAVNEEGNPIKLDPLSLMDKNGRCRATIKLDSIWVGALGISLQVKVWEADYNPKDSFLPRKGRISKTAQVYTSENNPLLALTIGAQKKESASPKQIEPKKEENEEGGDGEADGAGDIQTTPASAPVSVPAPVKKTKVVVNKVAAKAPAPKA